MNRGLKLARLAASVMLAAFFLSLTIGFWLLWPDVRASVKELRVTVKDTHAGVNDVVAESRDVTIAILKPCKGAVCGLVPGVSKVVADTGTAIQGIQGQVAQTAALTASATGNLNTLSNHLSAEVDALHTLTDAGTATANQTTADLKTLDGSLQTLPPLIINSGAAVSDLDARLKDESLRTTETNLATITGNFALTTTDFQTRFHALLFPPPCKTFACKMGRMWPAIREVPAFGESAYWTEQLMQNVKP